LWSRPSSPEVLKDACCFSSIEIEAPFPVNGTMDEYEIGDLSGKHGSLSEYTDTPAGMEVGILSVFWEHCIPGNTSSLPE